MTIMCTANNQPASIPLLRAQIAEIDPNPHSQKRFTGYCLPSGDNHAHSFEELHTNSAFRRLTPIVSSPSPAQYNPYRFQKNCSVTAEGFVLGVIEVVLQLFTGIFHGCAVSIHDLSPPRNTRFQVMT